MASEALEPINPLPEPKPHEPTQIERRMYDALDSLGIRYEPQRKFAMYFVDAYLPDYHIACEADGCVPHCCPVCNGDEPGLDNKSAALVRANQTTRDKRLRQWRGLRIIHIWGHDLLTDDAALASVQAALEREGIIVGLPHEPEPLPLPTAEEVRAAKRRASWERKLAREADRDRERPASVVEHYRRRAERESDLNLRSLLDEGGEDTEQ